MNTVILFFIILLLLVNIGSFALVGFDKQKSLEGDLRVPEVYLFFCALFFSATGVFTAMHVFRHKTRKWYFTLGIGFLMFQQILLLFFLIEFFNKNIILK